MIVHVSCDGSLMSIWFHSLRPILTVWCMVNLVVFPCCSWSNTQSSGLRNSNQAILLIAQSYWKKQQHQFRNQLQPSLHRSVIQNRQLTSHIFNRPACCTTAQPTEPQSQSGCGGRLLARRCILCMNLYCIGWWNPRKGHTSLLRLRIFIQSSKITCGYEKLWHPSVRTQDIKG